VGGDDLLIGVRCSFHSTDYTPCLASKSTWRVTTFCLVAGQLAHG
jgi:hypothetical protein